MRVAKRTITGFAAILLQTLVLSLAWAEDSPAKRVLIDLTNIEEPHFELGSRIDAPSTDAQGNNNLIVMTSLANIPENVIP